MHNPKKDIDGEGVTIPNPYIGILFLLLFFF